jgi:hypothetical protein
MGIKGLASFLVGIVVIFALGYWVLWNYRTDYFVVQQEVNLYPVSGLYAFLLNDQIVELPQRVGGLAEMAAEANKLLENGRGLKAKRINLLRDIEILEKKLTDVSSRLQSNRSRNIEEYRLRETQKTREKADETRERIRLWELQIDPQSTYDPRRLAIANLRVELANQDLEVARKRLEVAEHIVKEFGAFSSSNDTKAWDVVRDQVAEAKKELAAVDSAIGALRADVNVLMKKWEKSRAEQLGVLDFLYFSLGVTTTATFGDIIPNHYIARSCVTLQLVMSLVLVGLLVDALSARNASKRAP